MNLANMMRMFSHSEYIAVKSRYSLWENIRCQPICNFVSAGENELMSLSIQSRIKSLKLTQSAVADRAGISPGYLSELISGKKEPSMATMRALADALDCAPADLFPRQDRPADGFAEPDSAAFELLSTACQPDPEHMRSQVPGRAFFQLNRSAPGFALLAGDILTLQLGAASRDGDIVVATQIDAQGAGHSFVARAVGNRLLLDDPSLPPVKAQNGSSVAVMGTLVGVFRSISAP